MQYKVDLSFLFPWDNDFWSQQVPYIVEFLSYYVAIFFLRYFLSLTACVYAVTSVHYSFSLAVCVSPTTVFTGMRLELKEE